MARPFAISASVFPDILAPTGLASIETVQIWTPILNVHPSLLQIAIGRGLARCIDWYPAGA